MLWPIHCFLLKGLTDDSKKHLTGTDQVFGTQTGKIFHCEEVDGLNLPEGHQHNRDDRHRQLDIRTGRAKVRGQQLLAPGVAHGTWLSRRNVDPDVASSPASRLGSCLADQYCRVRPLHFPFSTGYSQIYPVRNKFAVQSGTSSV